MNHFYSLIELTKQKIKKKTKFVLIYFLLNIRNKHLVMVIIKQHLFDELNADKVIAYLKKK